MSFVNAIRSCLSQYATFRGRAARSELWFFVLFVIICAMLSTIIDRILGTTFHMTNPVTGVVQSMGYGYIYTLVALALMVPNISVAVRRLHDIERSGWWYWVVLIPILGAIILLVWFCTHGTRGHNDYGIDPLAGGVARTFS